MTSQVRHRGAQGPGFFSAPALADRMSHTWISLTGCPRARNGDRLAASEQYTSGKFDEAHVIYNEFKSASNNG